MIQRYACELVCGTSYDSYGAEMQESETGDYVLYTDHLAAVTELRDERDKLFNRCNALETRNRELQKSLAEWAKEANSYKVELAALRGKPRA